VEYIFANICTCSLVLIFMSLLTFLLETGKLHLISVDAGIVCDVTDTSSNFRHKTNMLDCLVVWMYAM